MREGMGWVWSDPDPDFCGSILIYIIYLFILYIKLFYTSPNNIKVL